jgi:2,3-bisphosphoglycerate-independent phosphoglycerate mutase
VAASRRGFCSGATKAALFPKKIMRILFLFLDGVGLGADDLLHNPFAQARMPVLQSLLGGRRLLAGSAPFSGPQADLLSLDACLGVKGLPQSATGQAVLLTGENVPQALGYHYGPKPNPEVAHFLRDGGLFGRFARAGRRAGLLNAYPPGYFAGIDSGKRLYSAIPLAVVQAGLSLFGEQDFFAGRAVSADFTGIGWRERLNSPDAPVLAPREAGLQLARLARDFDFSFFEYWLSDYAGHGQDLPAALALLEQFDAVLGGLCAGWDFSRDLILLTSDHGNLEDLSTRRHTANPVPLLLVGSPLARRAFAGVGNLTELAGKISQLLAAD